MDQTRAKRAPICHFVGGGGGSDLVVRSLLHRRRAALIVSDLLIKNLFLGSRDFFRRACRRNLGGFLVLVLLHGVIEVGLGEDQGALVALAAELRVRLVRGVIFVDTVVVFAVLVCKPTSSREVGSA